MTTLKELEDKVVKARAAYHQALGELEHFQSLAENNEFPDLDSAKEFLYENLYELCEDGVCASEFHQGFTVQGETYVAVYDRKLPSPGNGEIPFYLYGGDIRITKTS